MNAAGNSEDFFGIQFDHGAFFVFAVNWEEIQEFADMPLTAVEIALIPRGLRNQVIGKLLKNGQSTSRIKIEDIGILFSISVAV